MDYNPRGEHIRKDGPPRDKRGRFLKGFHYSPSTELTSERSAYYAKVNNLLKNPEGAKKSGLARRGKHNSPATEFKKGNIPAAPIRKGEHRSRDTEFKKGYIPANPTKKGERHSRNTEFKKGNIPWNKGKRHHSDSVRKMLTFRAPNREESWLINFFKRNNLPYEFVGDGKVMIENRNPDFINCNGRKKIIEFFGEHWHKPEDEKIKRQIYSKYGYDMLVIWGNDIRNEQRLLDKIIRFERR